MSRFADKYKNEIVPALREKFGISNPNAMPRLDKIVVSMGVGKAIAEKKRIDAALGDLATITGQRPKVCKARKSVSQFRLREGMPIGVMVTLRGKRMYEFLDRLISITLPRIRDFRGVNPRGFDGRGNYNLGISEQTVFAEVNLDKVEFVQGMNVTMVVRSSTDEMSREMMRLFGMPFRGQNDAERQAG